MIKLTNRLSAVAQLVREDASLADVGCDHGYLPAYLIMNGKIKSAVACDINKGPLDSCIQLVADYSFEDKIKCVLSDGLCNIAENECDDIAKKVIADETATKDTYETATKALNDVLMPIGAKMYQTTDGKSGAEESKEGTTSDAGGDEAVEGEVVDEK